MRFTRTGDIEIFDGTSWQAVEPLLGDEAIGDREQPPAAPADTAARPPESSEEEQQ